MHPTKAKTAPDRHDGAAPQVTSGEPRRSKAERRAATIEQMLDAAEELFAARGFHGVTLKEVAARVGVSSTLMHYHFRGKESLFDAVWERGVRRSVEARMEAMRRYADKAGDRPTVEGVLRTFIDVELDRYIDGDGCNRNTGIIAAQVNSAAEWGESRMRAFDPVVAEFIRLLRQALPGCDEKRIYWGFDFVSGTLTHALARTGRIDHLSNGLCSSEDFEEIKRHMTMFLAAGFHAIASPAQ